MKNKKLFKTLTISASSLAVAAAAITAPILVTSTINNRQAKKKDGKVNEGLTVHALGDTTTPLSTLPITVTQEAPSGYGVVRWVQILFNGAAPTDRIAVEGSEGITIITAGERSPNIFGIYCINKSGTLPADSKVTFSLGDTQVELALTQDTTTTKPSIMLKGGLPTEVCYHKEYTFNFVSNNATINWSKVRLHVQCTNDGKTVTTDNWYTPTGTGNIASISGISFDLTSQMVWFQLFADDITFGDGTENPGWVEGKANITNNQLSIDGVSGLNITVAQGQTKKYKVLDAGGNPFAIAANQITLSTGVEGVEISTDGLGTGEFTLTASATATSTEGTITVTPTEGSGYDPVNENLEVHDNYLTISKTTCTLIPGQSTTVEIKDKNGTVVEGISPSTIGEFNIEEVKTSPGTYEITAGSSMNDGNYTIVFSASKHSSVTLYIAVSSNVEGKVKPKQTRVHGKINTTFDIEFERVDTSKDLPTSGWSCVLDDVSSQCVTASIKSSTATSLIVSITATGLVSAGMVAVMNTASGTYPLGICDFYVTNSLVTVSGTSSVSIIDTDGQTLTASGATAYTWESSDYSICDVDANGKLTYKNIGKATITVYDADDQTAFDTIEINIAAPTLTVKQGNTVITDETVLAGTVSRDTTKDQFIQLTALLNSSTSTESDLIKWETSDAQVLTVSQGKISFVGPGLANVSVYVQVQNYKSEVLTFAVKLETYNYLFTETTDTSYQVQLPSGVEEPVLSYTSSTMGSAKTLTIGRLDPNGKSETPESVDLKNFSYKTYLLTENEFGTYIPSTPAKQTDIPVTVNENGVVTVNCNGLALIEATPTKDGVANPFYICYNVTNAIFTIDGEWAEHDRPHLSETKTFKLRDKDGNECSTSDYTIVWSNITQDTQTINVGQTEGSNTATLTFNNYDDGTTIETIQAVVKSKTSGLSQTVTTELKIAQADNLESSLGSAITARLGESQVHSLLVNGKPAEAGSATYASGDTSKFTINESSGVMSFIGMGDTTLTTTYVYNGVTQTLETPVSIGQGNIYVNYTWIFGNSYSKSVQLKVYDATGTQITENVNFQPDNTDYCDVVTTDGVGQVYLKNPTPESTGTVIDVQIDGVTQTRVQVYVLDKGLSISESKINATTVDTAPTLKAYLHGAALDNPSWHVQEGETAVSFYNGTGKLIYNSPTDSTGVNVWAEYTWSEAESKISVNLKSDECNVKLSAPTFDVAIPAKFRVKASATETAKFYVNGKYVALSDGKLLDSTITVTVKDSSEEVTTTAITYDSTTGVFTFVTPGTYTVTIAWDIGETKAPGLKPVTFVVTIL